MIDRQALHGLDDAGLAAALRATAPAIDWPTAGTTGADISTAVRARIVARPSGTRSQARHGRPWRMLPRSLVLALIALLVIAVVATAVGLGLPGLRLTLGGPTPPPNIPTLSPTEPVGLGLGLGMRSSVDEAATATGRPIPVPTDARFGAPDAVYLQMAPARQVTLIWVPSADLPADLDPSIGAILQSFEGEIEEPFIDKVISAGTVVAPVTVDGHDGYWIGGDAHWLMYRTADDEVIEDMRRWVGDALIWSDGEVTYRLETGLGRDATIAIAEDLD